MGSLAGSEIVGLSAVELAEAVRGRVLDPVRVTEAHVKRIRAVDPVVRAFVEVFEQEALAEAAELGRRGDLADLALAGVPVAVKDNLSVRGHPVRSGCAATASTSSGEDHPVVRLLRSAGAVVLGRTRLSELALWPQTEGAWGVTGDPWDLARNAGGSSGGSAAAVAAGMVPLAIGNDAMGSIRVPAASCGVVGVKPGQGVVPSEIGVNSWYGTAENGPLATTVDDVRVALAVLSGGAVGHADPGVDGVRIGVLDSSPFPGTRVSDEARAGMRSVAGALTNAGLTVRPAGTLSLQRFALPMFARWFATAHAEAAALDRSHLQPRTRRSASVGGWALRLGLVRDQDPAALRRVLAGVFADHDVLLTPVTAAAPPVSQPWQIRSWTVNVRFSLDWVGPFVSIWNMAGYPALVLPAGTWPDGLPHAAQLVAAPGGEETLLALASTIEKHHPWPRHAPLPPGEALEP